MEGLLFAKNMHRSPGASCVGDSMKTLYRITFLVNVHERPEKYSLAKGLICTSLVLCPGHSFVKI